MSKLKLPAICVILSALFAGSRLHAGNAVTEWNAIASTMIVTNGGKGSAISSVWFAYTSIAVYDAVNAIHGSFQPFYYSGEKAPGAADEAAAIAAAHRVLVTYFPAQQPALDAAFPDSLKQLPATAAAIADGVKIGESAAAALISARANDGLEANVTYTPGSGPGVWQPTPPKFGPAVAPWLGLMHPFTLSTPSQFLPQGPPSLLSNDWAEEYNEVRILGDANSAVRTPAQTEIGLFWTEHTGQQYARAFNYLVENYKLDVMESARLMAILWTGSADAAIACWNAKYTYNFWRPVTAIRAGGANPSLPRDPAWTPLGTTPSHPEYPSAHGCLTGAVSSLVGRFFGTKNVHVVIDSVAFKDGIHTHIFENTDDWLDEVVSARIFAGFHYRQSLKEGGRLGRRVSRHVMNTQFRSLADTE